MIYSIIESHKFFVTESRTYVGDSSGHFSFRKKLYYPIAYCKYMYWMIREIQGGWRA